MDADPQRFMLVTAFTALVSAAVTGLCMKAQPAPLAESGSAAPEPASAAAEGGSARGPRDDTWCAIGIHEAENARNASMLLRTAFLMGADAVFTVAKTFKKGKGKGSSWGPGDTLGASSQVQTLHCADVDDMLASLPADAVLVGVEKGGVPLRSFPHPPRAIYLLGAENAGLPKDVMARCHHIVELETVRGSCGGDPNDTQTPGMFNVR